MDYVDLPQGSSLRKEELRALTPAEYLQLIELCGPLERLAITIAGWLGARRGEGFGLRWQDLDLDRDVMTFRQGFVSARITSLKTRSSRAEMAIPSDVREALLEWKKHTPYSAPESWVFASSATNGERPFWPEAILANYIQPIAQAAGLGRIAWHTFRHSVSQWGKQALNLEETKEILRHSNIQTTSDIYKGLPLEGKREAQQRLVEFVRAEAKKSLDLAVSV